MDRHRPKSFRSSGRKRSPILTITDIDPGRASTRTFLEALSGLRPVYDHASADVVNGPVQKLCRDHRLTPYDALYIDLAMRNGCPLATQDENQKRPRWPWALIAFESQLWRLWPPSRLNSLAAAAAAGRRVFGLT